MSILSDKAHHRDEARLESVGEDFWHQKVTVWLSFRDSSYNLYGDQIIEHRLQRLITV